MTARWSGGGGDSVYASDGGVFYNQRSQSGNPWYYLNHNRIPKPVPCYCTDPIAAMELMAEGARRFGTCDVTASELHTGEFYVQFGQMGLGDRCQLREAIARAYIAAVDAEIVETEERYPKGVMG